MFRKAIGKATGLIGTSIDIIDTIIFSKLAKDVIAKELFKPFAGLIGAVTLAKIYLEKDKKSKTQLLVESIPGALVQVAIFAVEGPAMGYIFTVAIGVSSGLMVVEAVNKYRNEGLSVEDKFDLFIQTGKKAGILATITQGGIGNVFKLIETGVGATAGQKLAANATAVFSVVSAAKNGVKTLFCCGEKRPEEYTELEDQLLQMTDLEKADNSTIGVQAPRM